MKTIKEPEDLNMTFETDIDLEKEVKKLRNQELVELMNVATENNGPRNKIMKEEVKFCTKAFSKSRYLWQSSDARHSDLA